MGMSDPCVRAIISAPFTNMPPLYYETLCNCQNRIRDARTGPYPHSIGHLPQTVERTHVECVLGLAELAGGVPAVPLPLRLLFRHTVYSHDMRRKTRVTPSRRKSSRSWADVAYSPRNTGSWLHPGTLTRGLPSWSCSSSSLGPLRPASSRLTLTEGFPLNLPSPFSTCRRLDRASRTMT